MALTNPPRSFRARAIGLLITGIGLTASACAQFALRDGDRVAFYGDSITDNGQYTTLVETYVTLRYPDLKVRFFNAGVGGDKVSGGWMGPIDDRLSRDLFSRKPTVITSMLGMNDAGYQEFRQDLLDRYVKGYQHILDCVRTEAPKARVWLIKPSPYDDVTRPPTIGGGYNSVLLRYSDAVNQVAREYGHWTVDFNFPFADALYRAYAIDPAASAKIVPDRVHPVQAGHLIMASVLLKAWGAPRLSSEVGIDVPSGAVSAKGATVTNLKRDEAVEWVQTDERLPFPIDPKDTVAGLAVKSAPVISEILGPSLFRATGLKPGSYALTIDDEAVATFNAADLAAGVDLSRYPTPMWRQAADVHQLTLRRALLKYNTWRNVEYSLASEPSRERTGLIEAVDNLEEELIRRRRERSKPKPHRFRLQRVEG